MHQRRFPRPRRPHDRKPFPLRDVQRDMIESMNGAGAVVLARSVPVSRFLGGVELGDILNLNHFTLPSESPPAAPGAAAKSEGSPTTGKAPCYQPELQAAHSNAGQPERES